MKKIMKKFLLWLSRIFKIDLTVEKIIIKEVEKIVEKPIEIIKEVEKIVEVIKEVEVPVEIIKEVEKIVEIVKEVPIYKETKNITFDGEISGDVFVKGDLYVEGNLIVDGEVTCFNKLDMELV